MTKISDILCKIGGYEPEVVEKVKVKKTKFYLPSISLFVIFLTSGYGGHHLASLMFDNQFGTVLFTGAFMVLILLVDYMLLQMPKKGFTAFLRSLLAISLGSFIGILTILSIYKSDINKKSAELEIIKLEEKIKKIERDIIQADSRMNNYEELRQAAADEASTELFIGRNGRPAGPGDSYQSQKIAEQYFEDKKNKAIEKGDELNDKKAEYEQQLKTKKEAKKNVNNKKENESLGINAEVRLLQNLAKDEPFTYITMTIIFITLIVLDLIPFLVKWGGMDDTDNKYIEKLEEHIDNLEITNENLNNKKKIYEIKIDLHKLHASHETTKSLVNQVEKSKNDYMAKKIDDLKDVLKSKSLLNEEIYKIKKDYIEKKMNNLRERF